MKHKVLSIVAGTLALGGVLAGSAGVRPSEAASEQNLLQVALGAPHLTVLAEAVKAAGLAETLNGGTQLTIFAPSDEAFVALLGQLGMSKEALLSNKELLTSVLLNHVVAGSLQSGDVVAAGSLTTLGGGALVPAVKNGGAYIGDARIVYVNAEASNGVIHIIDHVLLPNSGGAAPSVAAPIANLLQLALGAPHLKVLAEAVKAAGLAETLNGGPELTIFAPSDEAFVALLGQLNMSREALFSNKELLTGVLLNHVVAGSVRAGDVLAAGSLTTLGGGALVPAVRNGGAYIGDARIVYVNAEASNGVIHIIDQVLLP